ncbi:MAG: hypothetical protein F6K26_48925, partial [Moorea sp. SIO2I5]|nr:hypothetical protein [Moorena sp. SIO2I5]
MGYCLKNLSASHSKSSFEQKVLTATAVTVTVGFGSISGAIAQSLTGGGATFPEPLYRRYF